MLYKTRSKAIVIRKPLWIRCLCLALLFAVGSVNAQDKLPDSTKVDIKKGGLEEIVDYSCTDSLVYDVANSLVYLYGKATLNYGTVDLKAGKITINLKTKYITANGSADSLGNLVNLPILKDGEEEYKADSMEYNGEKKKGRVYGLTLAQDGAIIHLTKVLKDVDGSFIGERGKITTCDEKHPHFYFNANKIKVIPNNKVLFGPANLVIEDVPTPLAVPFGIAPLRKGRQNGILFPSYGYNQFNKTYYLQNLGWYQGLGKYADLSMLTDFYFNGDFRLGARSQFAKMYKYNGSIALNYSQFNTGQIEKTKPEFFQSKDFEIIFDYRLDPKMYPGHNLGGNLNFKTAAFNRLNNRNVLSASNNLVVSSFTYNTAVINKKVNITVGLNHNQNLQTREFNITLPSVNMSLSSFQPFKLSNSSGNKWYEQIRVSYVADFQNLLSSYDSLLFSNKAANEFKKLRNGIRHSVPISANLKLLGGIVNMNPYFNYSENWYFKRNTLFRPNSTSNVDTLQDKGLFRSYNYNGGLSFTTNIYGTIQKTGIKNISAIRHTITPTINFNYTPKIDGFTKNWQSKYRDSLNREITYAKLNSPVGSANSSVESGSVNFALNNTLQAKRKKVDSTGKVTYDKINLFNNLGLNTGYNLLADSFNWSDLTVSFNTILVKTITFNAGGSWSLYDTKNGYTKIKGVFAWDKNWKKPLKFLNGNASLSGEINSTLFDNKKGAAVRDFNGFTNFKIPWSIGTTLTTGFSAIGKPRAEVSFNGSINVTPEWGVTYNTGFNFKTKQISQAQIGLRRDLHCWQLSFDWTPNGFNKGWVFTLRPKSNLLQDLKIPKRVVSQPFAFGNY